MEMTSPGIGDPLTEMELSFIQQTAVEYRSGLDIDRIKNLVRTSSKGVQRLLEEEVTDLSTEETLARQLLINRTVSYEEEHLNHLQFLLTEEVINTGAKIIRNSGDHHRFEPCIEKILELSHGDINKVQDYMKEFEHSDYDVTSAQHTHEMQNKYRKILSDDESGNKIAKLLDLYQTMVGIFETNFPNLLALKRILDGDTPSNQVLQKKSFSSVCRELTNIQEEPNSVFFDLIVNKYDRHLRNALAHGDIINDTIEEEVRITSTEYTYSYADIEKICQRNLSNVHFLIGYYRCLIEWKSSTYQSENITRERLDI